MDALHTGLLIRALIVLVTICLLVIAGLVIARHEKRRASNPQGDHPTNATRGQAAIVRTGSSYRTHGERTEANDAEVSAHPRQRRAA